MILFWELCRNRPNLSSDPASCDVFPLVLSSFKDQHSFADIDTPADPAFFFFPNNASARSNSAFVSEAVNDLLLEEFFLRSRHC